MDDTILTNPSPRPFLGRALALCVVTVVLLHVAPEWRRGFEVLRAFETWPLIILALAAAVWIGGWLRYRRSGRAAFAPILARLCGSVLVGASSWLLLRWSANWSVPLCCAGLVLLLVTSFLLALQHVVYAEPWRRRWNGRVVDRIEQALRCGPGQTSEFARWLDRLEEESEAGRVVWRSPHLESALAEISHSARAHLFSSDKPTAEALGRYVTAARMFWRYRRVTQAPQGYDDKLSDWVEAEMLRQLLTTIAVQDRALRERALDARWEQQLIQDLTDCGARIGTQSSYFHLLTYLLSGCVRNGVQDDEEQILSNVLDDYEQIPEGIVTLGTQRLDLRATAAHTWLALAPRITGPEPAVPLLSRQSCFDLWFEWRGGGSPWVDATDREDDPAWMGAQHSLAELYAWWCSGESGVPSGWSAGLSGRAHFADARAGRVRPSTRMESARSPGESSWPHAFVWRTRRIRRAIACRTALAWSFFTVLLVTANPRLPRPAIAWNTVDHLGDRRWFSHDSDAAVGALASSESWLALATEKGVVVMNKDSLLPWRETAGRAVVDVTAVPNRDEFLALDADQGIRRIVPRLGTAPDIDSWLTPPKSPVWVGSRALVEPSAVVAQEIDAAGWLLAVRGRGLARYQFEQGRPARSWQTSELSTVPLDEAVITERGVWLTLQSGGIRLADRRSLASDLGRSIATPPIRRFEADPSGRWAAAVDTSGGLWTYGGTTYNWNGPTFRDPDNAQLGSVGDVQIARFAGAVAWLGTRAGLYGYDVYRRHIFPYVLNTEVLEIVPLAVSDSDSDISALVAGSQGISLVTRHRRDAARPFSSVQLDHGPVLSMTVSADRGSCVYRIRTNAGDVDVRALSAPFDGAQPRTLIAGGQHWKPAGKQIRVNDLLTVGNVTLFSTNAGSFSYDHVTHQYRDSSKSIFGAVEYKGEKHAEQTRDLQRFGVLHDRQGQVLTIADGNPQRLERHEQTWRSLDPLRLTRPESLAEAQGSIFGVGHGTLFIYDSVVPTAHGQGRVAIRGPVERVLGDMSNQPAGREVTFVLGGKLLQYRPDGDVLSTVEPALPVTSDVVELRSAADGIVLRDRAGRLMDPQRKILFGAGALPHSPRAISAVALARDGNTVLVGGPHGSLTFYEGDSGAWRAHALPTAGSVTRVEDTPGGVLARDASGTVFQQKHERFVPLPAWRTWATSKSGFMIATQNGIERLAPKDGQDANRWDKLASFGGATGMRGMAAKSAFVWQASPTRIVFLTESGEIGSYDAERDVWQRQTLRGVSRIRRFVPRNGSLVLVGDKRIWELRSDLRLNEIATAPTDPFAMAASASRLHMAFADRSTAWFDVSAFPGADFHRISRGGMGLPAGFDPGQVVAAASAGELAVLVQRTGAVSAYDALRGQWRDLRRARPGEQVVGTVDENGTKVPVLFHQGGVFTLLRLPKGERGDLGAIRTTPVVISQDASKLAPLAEGVLMESLLRVTRKGGVASYEVKVGDDWEPWFLVRDGFVQDRMDALAFDDKGHPFGVAGGHLYSLHVNESETGFLPRRRSDLDADRPVLAKNRGAGEVHLLFANGDPILAGQQAAQAPVITTFADHSLAWTPATGRGAVAHWPARPDQDIPVWGTCGALALGCVLDMAVDKDDVLLATEAGLVVRRLADGHLKRFWPEVRVTRFVKTSEPDRLLMVGGAVVHAWKGSGGQPERLSAGAERALDSLASRKAGTWKVERLPSGASRLQSIVRAGGVERQLVSVDEGWRFDDDIATALLKPGTTDWLVLQTFAGLFSFTREHGRSFDAVDAPPSPPEPSPPEPVTWASAALRIRQESGKISFTGPGGEKGPVFVNDRLYFNNVSGACGTGEHLYTAVPGRGVFRRDPTALGKIDRLWAMPAELADLPHIAMICTQTHLQIRAHGNASRAWQLALDDDNGHWELSDSAAGERTVHTGLIGWRQNDSTSPFVPYLLATGAELSNWWQGDRFAWDAIKDAGALTEKQAVLLTAAGLVWAGLDDKRGILQALRPDAHALYLTSARRDGAVIGLVAGSERRSQLVRPTPDGAPLIEEAPRGLLAHSQVTLALRPGDSALRLRESWVPIASPADKPIGPAFTVEVPRLNASEILHDGQFIFDRAEAAVPLGDSWIVLSPSLGKQRFASLYRLRDGVLDLRQVWPISMGFQALRDDAAGFIGLEVGADAAKTWRATVDDKGLSCCKDAALDPRAAFPNGQRVRIDVTTLSWRAEAVHRLERADKLDTEPANARLWVGVEAGLPGIALSFDILTSLSIDPVAHTLLAGTWGGLFVRPFEASPVPTLACDGARLMSSAGSGETGLIVRRVRSDLDGLWMHPGRAAEAVMCTGAVCRSAQGTWRSGAHDRAGLLEDDAGVFTLGRLWRTSDDQWWLDRRAPVGVVEFAVDRTEDAVWLATARNGVFKITRR